MSIYFIYFSIYASFSLSSQREVPVTLKQKIRNWDFSDWNVRNVTDMREMFRGATAFNQPLDTWNIEQVQDMNHMFFEATAFNQSLGTWKLRTGNCIECGTQQDLWYASWDCDGWCGDGYPLFRESSRQEASKILARAIGLMGSKEKNAVNGTGKDNGTGTTDTKNDTETGTGVTNTEKVNEKDLPSFTDIDPNSEFLPYINALREAKVLSGKTPTLFDPAGNISRNEAGKIVGKVFIGG